ncbi:MAG: alpha/beta hydrolase [Tannerellaceae bacterium]|nr:alpha/beta hydrolase [Tannerellaceae bacterium]
MKKSIFFVLAVLVCWNVQGQTSVKSTWQFAVRGSETLYLDRYVSADSVGKEPSPCVIFVFGGAFARGSRDVPKYIPYFDYLVDNGYTVVSIDYRLGLKEASQQQGLSEEEFAKYFINAVDMAVEDLLDATRFVLDRAEEWNIDPAHIVTNGSSAGAVTVLQAEYAICNNLYNVSQKLPAGFRYAGVISFAGAIFVPQGDLQWNIQPAPLMLLHGDADLQVPYDKLVFGPMGFYGPGTITGTLKEKEYPYYFYKFIDYGHEIASDPMQQNREDVLWFLHTFVRDQKNYQIYKEQKETGRPVRAKDFGFMDYVKGNFDR